MIDAALRKAVKVVEELALEGTSVGETLNTDMIATLVKAAALLHEREQEVSSLRQCVLVLLVKGFPNGVSITAKEGQQSHEYQLWSATDSDDVLTLRAKPALPEELRAEGGLDGEDGEDMPATFERFKRAVERLQARRQAEAP